MLLMPCNQDVRGTTALAAGVMLVPQGIGTLLSRTVVGSNIDQFGSRPDHASRGRGVRPGY